MGPGDGAAGRFVLSVELELALDRSTIARQQQLEHISRRLLSLFERHELRATWGVADPAHSAATAAILAGPVPHEVAVLGEDSWLGPGAGRSRIERELARRIGGARQRGIAVTTLLVRDVAGPLDLGLLLDQQISAVASSTQWMPAGSCGLRFGVWQAPSAWRLPATACWWRPIGWQVARLVRQARGQERIVHLAIDGDALVDQGDRGLAQVAGVMEQIARLRSAGTVAVSTMAEYAAENLAHRFPQSAKSLLSPAA